MASMETCVALLRGINVSGLRQIRMADLQQSFAAMGFTGIRTYLQSGNVVFDAPHSDTAAMAAEISARIEADFAHQVAVLVITARQLQAIEQANPLQPVPTDEQEKLFHATFLYQPVSPEKFAHISLPLQANESAHCGMQVLYLYCPGGYGKTKLNNTFFEKKLGMPATTRNWRSVRAILALCDLPKSSE